MLQLPCSLEKDRPLDTCPWLQGDSKHRHVSRLVCCSVQRQEIGVSALQVPKEATLPTQSLSCWLQGNRRKVIQLVNLLTDWQSADLLTGYQASAEISKFMTVCTTAHLFPQNAKHGRVQGCTDHAALIAIYFVASCKSNSLDN